MTSKKTKSIASRKKGQRIGFSQLSLIVGNKYALAGVTALLILMFVTSFGAVKHIQLAHDQEVQRQKAAAARAQTLSASTKSVSGEGIVSTTKPASDSATKPSAVPTTATSSPKYSTSSDPRSTAYSTTPPAANPDSFMIKITHAGQVPAGTVISYNANKSERTYYGGDLLLSTTSMTISKSTSSRADRTITISSPDGEMIGCADIPWDDTAMHKYFFMAQDSATAVTSGTVCHPWVEFFNNPPNGTYTLHLNTGRTAQTPDGWTYDGFIALTIVD